MASVLKGNPLYRFTSFLVSLMVLATFSTKSAFVIVLSRKMVKK
jgi:hypothetical protein